MKIIKFLLILTLTGFMIFYICYSFLSMKIYNKLTYYKAVNNKTAVRIAESTLKEKFPGSLGYFIYSLNK